MPVWDTRSARLRQFSGRESVASRSAERCLLCVSVATVDSGTAARLCREQVRRKQRREANRRYQQSERGRQSHRHRQRSYRRLQAQARVTDQAVETIKSPAPARRPILCHCTICGRYSHWVNPFPTIPRRR